MSLNSSFILQEQQQDQQQDLMMGAPAVSAIPVSTALSTAQYKMKSKMMNKFFNDPVEALDLRLGKAEDNIKSVEAWLANPLTEVKQEEAAGGLFANDHLHNHVKLECPLDYSEVQVATPPTPPSDLPRLFHPPAQQPDGASLPEDQTVFSYPTQSRFRQASGEARSEVRAAQTTGTLPQRVILNPGGQQEAGSGSMRLSPNISGNLGRYLPYPSPSSRIPRYSSQSPGDHSPLTARERHLSNGPWAAAAEAAQKRLEASSSPLRYSDMNAALPESTLLSGRSFSAGQMSPSRREYSALGGRAQFSGGGLNHHPSPTMAQQLSQLSPMHPALHGMVSSTSPHGSRQLSGFFHSSESASSGCGTVSSSPFSAGVPLLRTDHSGPNHSHQSSYLQGGGGGLLHAHQHQSHGNSPPGVGRPAGKSPIGGEPSLLAMPSSSSAPPPSAPTGLRQRGYMFSNPTFPNNNLSSPPCYWGPPSTSGSNQRHVSSSNSSSWPNSSSAKDNIPGSLSPLRTEAMVIKTEAAEEDEEDVTRISFTERSAFGRSLRHSSGGRGGGSPTDIKPRLALSSASPSSKGGNNHINMDDKIALAENMTSTFNGNPLLLSIPSSSTSKSMSSDLVGETAARGAGGLLHAAPTISETGHLSPPEQDRLAAYYASRSAPSGQNQNGQPPPLISPSLNPFWGMRPTGHHSHTQYLRSREMMQDYAAVQAAVAAAAVQSCRRDLGWGSGASGNSLVSPPGGALRLSAVGGPERQSSVIVRHDKQQQDSVETESKTTTTLHQRSHGEQQLQQQRLLRDQPQHHQHQQRLELSLPDNHSHHLHHQSGHHHQHMLPDSSKHQQQQQQQRFLPPGGGSSSSNSSSFLMNLPPKERDLHKSWLSLQSARMCNLVQQAASTNDLNERLKQETDTSGGERGEHGRLKYSKAAYATHAASFPKPYQRYEERAGHHNKTADFPRQIKEERKIKMVERLTRVSFFTLFFSK